MEYSRDTLIKIIKLGKPQFVFAIFIYFLIGVGFALLMGAPFILSKFIWGYLVIFMSSMAIHHANDYFDFDLDHYGVPTTFTGGSGILVENPQLKGLSIKLAIFFISLSIIIGAFFTIKFSYPITFFLFVLFGNFLVWCYAGPPIKFSYRRIGEIANTLMASSCQPWAIL